MPPLILLMRQPSQISFIFAAAAILLLMFRYAASLPSCYDARISDAAAADTPSRRHHLIRRLCFRHFDGST